MAKEKHSKRKQAAFKQYLRPKSNNILHYYQMQRNKVKVVIRKAIRLTMNHQLYLILKLILKDYINRSGRSKK